MLIFNQYTTGTKGPVVDPGTPLDSLDSTAVLGNILAWTLDKTKPTSTLLKLWDLVGCFTVINHSPVFSSNQPEALEGGIYQEACPAMHQITHLHWHYQH